MKTKSPAFQWYPSDFLSDYNTMTMTAEEVGVYILLLSHCWLENGLPDDPPKLALIGRCDEGMLLHILDKLFYKNSDGLFQNQRLDMERKKQKSNSKKRKMAAKVRWDKEKGDMQMHSKSNAKEMQMECPSITIPITTSITSSDSNKTPKPPPGAYSEPFELFWKQYPVGNSVKKTAFKAWKKYKLDPRLDEVLKSLAVWKDTSQWKEGYVKHATTWLNGECFDQIPEKVIKQNNQTKPRITASKLTPEQEASMAKKRFEF